MPTFNLPTETAINFSKGSDQFFIYLAGEIPFLVPLLLTAFFLIVAFGGYTNEVRRRGTGDFATWFSAAGFATAILAILLSFVDGMMTTTTLTTAIVVAIIGAVWLMATD